VKFGRRLEAAFYDRPVLVVARELLGKVLVHASRAGTLAGRIVEVEAYRGPEDRAAHSFGGRRTQRTEAMFGPAGHAYMFFVYGMHWHFNVVVGARDVPHAILIRALEPVFGVEQMSRRRKLPASSRELARGPGKLCQALGLDRSHYGLALTKAPLYICEGVEASSRRASIGRSARIGVDYAGSWAEKPWRFFLKGNAFVSGPAHLNGSSAGVVRSGLRAKNHSNGRVQPAPSASRRRAASSGGSHAEPRCRNRRVDG
jgi:DNA-3-methyladenine glycosylase